MHSLHELQHEFLGYLLDNADERVTDRILSTPARPAQQRLGFYAHAYRARLKEALGTDFERLHAYLGDELFEQLVDAYIDACPSHHASLRDFGSRLPGFVAGTEPFSQWPEVAEIAVIEQAFADSFDAADAECVTLQALSELEPEAWATLRLELHGSVRLLRQRCNSFHIWQALSEDQQPPQKTTEEGAWLVWRQELVSRYRSLDEAEANVLEITMSGANFADICLALTHNFSEQETAHQALGYLQQWLHDGMVIRLASAAE